MLLRNVLLLAMVLLGFSYASTTVIMLSLGVPTGPVNAVIKTTVMLMFVTVLLVQPKTNSDDYYRIFPMVVFFIIYSIRMLYDIIIYDIVFVEQSIVYVTGYFFGLTLIPAVTTALRFDARDIRRLHNWILIALIIANIAVTAYTVLGGLVTEETAFSTRVQVEGDLAGTAVLNPITISLMGSMMAVFIMGRLLTIRTDSIPVQSALLGCIVLGCFNIILGGSRGPVLSFVVCSVLIFVAMIRSPLSPGGLQTRPIMWIYGGVGIAALISFLVAQGDQIFLFERFRDMFESRAQGGREERDFLADLAISDFERAPIFGYSYVTSVGGFHPHNLILEALMATGGVGMTFLGMTMFLVFRGAWRMMGGSLGPYGFSIALVTIMMFITSMLSGSVGQFPELWVFMALLVVLGNQKSAPSASAPIAADLPFAPRKSPA